MKKLIGLAVLVAAGAAFAASLSVPWFVDTPQTNCGFPPLDQAATVGLVYLHNNQTGTIVCQIAYFTQDGYPLGPLAPANTFTIPTASTMAFRPVVSDMYDATHPLGQESPVSVLVPNRPKVASLPGGTKNNGSMVVTWVGKPTDVQGIYVQSTNVSGVNGRIAHWGTLLPPGAD
jgi:hypothetical protein